MTTSVVRSTQVRLGGRERDRVRLVAESRGSTATPERGQSAQKKGLIARVLLFYRQVVAEMRKVVWPTRNELITYTIVVVVFVAAFAVDRPGVRHRRCQGCQSRLRLTDRPLDRQELRTVSEFETGESGAAVDVTRPSTSPTMTSSTSR